MRSLAKKSVLLLVGLACLLGTLWLFKIKHLECRLDAQPCPEVVITALQSLQGHSLFFTDLDYFFVSQPVLTQYQLQKVDKKLPHTFIVHLVSYPTTYQLHFTETTTTYVINAQRQLYQEEIPGLITIRTPLTQADIVTQNHLEPDLHFFLTTLVQALAETKLQPTEITLENKHLVRISLKGGINGIISNENTYQQVTHLAFIEKNFDLMTIDQGIKVIDVRYTLPVLRTTYTW